MNLSNRKNLILILITICVLTLAFFIKIKIDQQSEINWIDKTTGHRVVRLSSLPDSISLYFHQNAFTSQGDKVIIKTPKGLSSVDLATRKIELLVPDFKYTEASSTGVEVGRKTRTLYYQKNVGSDVIFYSIDIDTKQTQKIATLPTGSELGGVNADETKIIGKTSKIDSTGATSTSLFSVDIKTGKYNVFYKSTKYLNHIQPSPTDPSLVLFCHEGPWESVDRIWTINTSGANLRLMHNRSQTNEIAGHEFWSNDGKMIWYDLQTPRSENFWLAGVNTYTKERVRYPLLRDEWSVHYNQSQNGTYFAGDGGGPTSVANYTADGKHLDPQVDGQWIRLFTPKNNPTTKISTDSGAIKIDELKIEKLVNLSKNNYKELEPNISFTPDNKWIVFRSNISGSPHVYMVEIAKQKN